PKFIKASITMLLNFYSHLDRYSQSLIVLGICLLAGYAIRFIILRIIKSISKRSADITINSIFNRIKVSWFLFIPLILFLIFFPRSSFDHRELNYIIKITQTLIIISFSTVVI